MNQYGRASEGDNLKYNSLNPDKALIFRIVHIRNVPWILANGMHCRKSNVQAPNYFTIGNSELIEKRIDVPIPVHPEGTLEIMFRFTLLHFLLCCIA